MSFSVKTDEGIQSVVNIGEVVDMPMDEFSLLVTNVGYASSMNNLLKLVFKDIESKLVELNGISEDIKDSDVGKYVEVQNTMAGLIINAKKVEDKLLYLKEYMGLRVLKN